MTEFFNNADQETTVSEPSQPSAARAGLCRTLMREMHWSALIAGIQFLRLSFCGRSLSIGDDITCTMTKWARGYMHSFLD